MFTPYSTSRSGIYPGSGIARGGQQGRSAIMHNGIGGTRAGGGITAGSSPATSAARVVAQATAARPPSAGTGIGTVAPGTPPPVANGGYLRVYIKGANGKYTIGTMHRSKMTPAQLHAALASPLNKAAAAPTPESHADPAPGAQPDGAAPAPSLSPLSFKDSNYWYDYDQAQRDYRAKVDPLNAERAALTDTAKYGGKTLYDVMFDEAQQKWTQDLRSTRDQQAKANLLRSGHGQNQLVDLDGVLRKTQTGISDQYGAGRLTSLNTQLANYNADFNDPGTGQLANIARAAQARAVAQEQARIQATYGMTLDPSKFQFAQE